jgi:hypothetical protein
MALTYTIAGRRLEIASTSGPPHSLDDTIRVLREIRENPGVPSGVGLLIDVRGFRQPLDTQQVHQRLVTLFDELRSKIAPVCAFVISDALPHAVTSTFVLEFGRARGIRMIICRDVAEARAWLDLVTAGA